MIVLVSSTNELSFFDLFLSAHLCGLTQRQVRRKDLAGSQPIIPV